MPEGIVYRVVSATRGNDRQREAEEAGNLHSFGDVEAAGNNHNERPEGTDNTTQERERPPRHTQGKADTLTASKVIVHSLITFRLSPANNQGDNTTHYTRDATRGMWMEAKRGRDLKECTA